MPGYLQNPIPFRLLVSCLLVSLWFQRLFLNMASPVQWRSAVLQICVWRTDVLCLRHPISSIWSSLCQHKIRPKLFPLITKICFHLDKSLSHAERSWKPSYFFTWKSSKCYELLYNLAHKVLGIGQMSKVPLLHHRLQKELWTGNIVLFIFPWRLGRPLENGKWERKLNRRGWYQERYEETTQA